MQILTRVSPRFELPYAIGDLVSPKPALDSNWAPGGAWRDAARSFGWSFWLALPDALDDAEPPRSLDAFIEALAELPAEQFAHRIRRGLFHGAEGEAPPAEKREWLHYVGLDGSEAPAAMLRDDAAEIQARSLAILRDAAEPFGGIWTTLQAQLERSAERAERLARACSLAELARELLLRIEVDGSDRIHALRGGYAIASEDVERVYLMPSAFNARRFWTAADETLPATLFFPYFDASIDVRAREAAPGEYDPWLVCRAIGDPTRAAILRRIAERPQTASDLLAALDLSKATMSHHIYQLREAGLIDERRSGRSVTLSLRREAIEQLTPALRRELGG